MPIIADYHLHTHHSEDSTAPMEDMIKSAIDKNLLEICFTEHLDLDYPKCPDLPEHPFLLDVESYREEVLKYQALYKDKLTIRFGVEIGMQTHIAKENADFIKRNDFDFVIASIHLVDKKDPYYPDFWEGKSSEEVFKRYFESTLENIRLFDDFDVLGHLDYATRYAPDSDLVYSYDKFSSCIDPILSYLAQNNKGLDLNSKLLSRDNNLNPNPRPEIIKRFKELGGRIITFGSDAHKKEPVACGFDKMRQIALDCGFTEYYTFDKRNPIAHSL